MQLTDPAQLKRLMKELGFTTRKGLGQNFLIDQGALEAIVNAVEPAPADVIIEIGPGLGTLTRALAQRAGLVTAIELDERLVAVLPSLFEGLPQVEVVQGDATRVDLAALLADRLPPGAKAKVAANLPYYVTTPLVMRLLEEELPLSRAVVMVQKEVAERMVADPGSKTYGALSVAVQFYTVPRLVRVVSRQSFLPAPAVDSAVVALDFRPEPPVEAPRAAFFAVVKAAFGQRRKTLQNALANGLGLPREAVADLLTAAGVEGGRRGETLSLAEFAAIARGLPAQGQPALGTL